MNILFVCYGNIQIKFSKTRKNQEKLTQSIHFTENLQDLR